MAYFSKNNNQVSTSFRDALKDVLGPKVEEEKVEKKEELLDEASETGAQNLEDLTEEELFDVMEQELGPHIAYLLDEGFNEEEIENIIVEMLSEESED